MLKLTDFDYTLPPECIAKYPAEPRDSSKLLVINRATKEMADSTFANLTQFLQPGDVLVRNNTKVIPARIFGKKESGGTVELLLTKKVTQTHETETWECLTKPGLKVGQIISLSDSLTATCTGISTDGYTRDITFSQTGSAFFNQLQTIGTVPLPPYIADAHTNPNDMQEKYQTTYAKHDGSAAAPTAGLHFTTKLDARLRDMGVEIVELTLHVGLGTFLPVKTTDITKHHMHGEWFELTSSAAKTITQAKAAGNRVVAVGTTSARVLESCAQENNGVIELTASQGETEIYMYPPYRFKCVDALITNFHLPQSTLLMLVSAFCTQPNTEYIFTNFGESLIGDAYAHAIKSGYRFYSFGDAMLIL